MAIRRYFCKLPHEKSASSTLRELEAFLEARFRRHRTDKKSYPCYSHSISAYADGFRGARRVRLATVHVVKRRSSGCRFVSVVLATCPRLLAKIERELLCRGFTTMTIMPPQGLSHLVRRLNWQDLIAPWVVARSAFWKESLSRSTHLVGGSAMMPSRVLFSPCPLVILDAPQVD